MDAYAVPGYTVTWSGAWVCNTGKTASMEAEAEAELDVPSA